MNTVPHPIRKRCLFSMMMTLLCVSAWATDQGELESAQLWTGKARCLLTFELSALGQANLTGVIEALGHLEPHLIRIPGLYQKSYYIETTKVHWYEESCVAELQVLCMAKQEAIWNSVRVYGWIDSIQTSLMAPVDYRGYYRGCTPVEGDDETQPELSPDPAPQPDYRDNFVRPAPILLPVPLGTLGGLRIVQIPPESAVYPFASELARILMDSRTPSWVSHSILATLAVSGAAAILLALGGSVTGGASTSISWAPLVAAGAAIILICKSAGLEVNESALKKPVGSQAMHSFSTNDVHDLADHESGIGIDVSGGEGAKQVEVRMSTRNHESSGESHAGCLKADARTWAAPCDGRGERI